MKPDGTDSLSTAAGAAPSPKVNTVTEQERNTGSEVKLYTPREGDAWSYLFVHHAKVAAMEEWLKKDGVAYFVHRTVRYFKKTDRQKVQHKETPTVSGLVFFQGDPRDIQEYIHQYYPYMYLCRDCTTGRVARITDERMRPFMRVNATDPGRIRFLLKPFHYYARNRIMLRIVSGDLAGLEGYVIRIDRDRRLVMNVGGMSVAISGVHAEHFETVEEDDTALAQQELLYKRNLQERETLIDRYFHPVRTAREAAVQAENIDYLREYTLAELAKGRATVNDAWRTFAFVIREIGYYFTPPHDKPSDYLNPIMAAGGRVLQEMDGIIDGGLTDADTRARYETEQQELMSKYEYLF